MGKSDNRIKAEQLWREAKGKRALADIARELGVSSVTVSKWKKLDQWSVGKKRKKPEADVIKTGKRGGQYGNKNAVGNNGGAPIGSKNALKTGRYESILMNTLTDEERELVPNIQLDKIIVLHEELMLLTIRERRMMARIAELIKKSPTGMGITKLVKSEGVTPTRFGEPFNETSNVTEIMPILHTIQRIEEALTKVQARKQLVVDQLHRIENDDRMYELSAKRLELDAVKAENASIIPADDNVDDGFLDALSEKAIEVWADDDADEDQ